MVIHQHKKGSKDQLINRFASLCLSVRLPGLWSVRFACQQLTSSAKVRLQNQTHPLRLDAVRHPTPADPPYSMSPYTIHPTSKNNPTHPAKITKIPINFTSNKTKSICDP